MVVRNRFTVRSYESAVNTSITAFYGVETNQLPETLCFHVAGRDLRFSTAVQSRNRFHSPGTGPTCSPFFLLDQTGHGIIVP